MNNLSITKQNNDLYTVIVGGMTNGKMCDWALALLGDDATVTETKVGNWKYIFTIEDVTEVGLEKLRECDFSIYPDGSESLQKGVDIADVKTVLCMNPGFQFRRENGYMATYLLRGDDYIFIVETEDSPLLMAGTEENLTDFLNS